MSVPLVSRKPRLLVMEFWGLGDLTFSTPLLHAAAPGWDVTLVGKAHARPLLEPTFPAMRFIGYDAPWSAYRGKYELWRWDWPALAGLIARLRRERFDAVVSVRNDPRDHLLMWLIDARRRLGFPHRGSEVFLTDALIRSKSKQHKVEDWRDICRALELAAGTLDAPRLAHPQYRSARVDALLAGIDAPLLCLHAGARIAVRRWPAEYFAQTVARLRERFHFHLLLIPDVDGYGAAELGPLADTVVAGLSVGEMVDVLGRCELLLCNDSGPGHVAASCGRPAIPIFGPTDPEWFRPWGEQHHIVIRDICPWRPCFDYCKFREPYCLTKLRPEQAIPEIEEHLHSLIARGAVSPRLSHGNE